VSSGTAETTLVEAMVSSVALDVSEIAIEGGGVRLVSNCSVDLEEVLVEGNTERGAGND